MYLSASASQRRGFVNKSQFFTAIRRIGLGARSPLQHMSRDDVSGGARGWCSCVGDSDGDGNGAGLEPLTRV